ncbi:MAG: GTPase ObgE, partial [Sulfurimonas sp.]
LQFLRHIERTKTLLFMVDLASYHNLQDQFETLSHELKTYSQTLHSRSFAIALTRVDAIPPQEAPVMVRTFIESLGLTPSAQSAFNFDAALGFYEQQSSDEQRAYEQQNPFFIAPVSSVMHTNIDAVTFALYELVKLARQ